MSSPGISPKNPSILRFSATFQGQRQLDYILEGRDPYQQWAPASAGVTGLLMRALVRRRQSNLLNGSEREALSAPAAGISGLTLAETGVQRRAAGAHLVIALVARQVPAPFAAPRHVDYRNAASDRIFSLSSGRRCSVGGGLTRAGTTTRPPRGSYPSDALRLRQCAPGKD